MSVPTVVAVCFALVAGLTFAVGALLLRLLPSIRAERLAAPVDMAGTGNVSILRWEERAARDWHALVERAGRWLTPRDASLLARYRKRLIRGGFHNPSAVAVFLGSKTIIA